MRRSSPSSPLVKSAVQTRASYLRFPSPAVDNLGPQRFLRLSAADVSNVYGEGCLSRDKLLTTEQSNAACFLSHASSEGGQLVNPLWTRLSHLMGFTWHLFTDIHFPQRVNPTDFGDPLTTHEVDIFLSQIWWIAMKYSRYSRVPGNTFLSLLTRWLFIF